MTQCHLGGNTSVGSHLCDSVVMVSVSNVSRRNVLFNISEIEAYYLINVIEEDVS